MREKDTGKHKKVSKYTKTGKGARVSHETD
jgi:hypothetical protein